jgi:hypothetical protein
MGIDMLAAIALVTVAVTLAVYAVTLLLDARVTDSSADRGLDS